MVTPVCLNDSHSGNASIRDNDLIWITPSGCCADTLEETMLVKCPLSGPPGPGASLDARLHMAIYRENLNSGCVLHSHGPYSLAMTFDGKDFVPLDFEGQYYFDVIPVLNIAYDDYLEESPQRVADALAKYKICVVRGHGVYAQAETINLAYKWSCTLEQVAKTAYLVEARNR